MRSALGELSVTEISEIHTDFTGHNTAAEAKNQCDLLFEKSATKLPLRFFVFHFEAQTYLKQDFRLEKLFETFKKKTLLESPRFPKFEEPKKLP